MARVAAAVPIGPANARKAKIAKEEEPLYDHTVKIKTTRPTRSKNDLLTIAGYFLVGGTKARCLFNSGCEGIIMSSEFARATGIRMHKLPEPTGIQQAFQGSRAKLYYTATTDITVGQRTYTETFDIANVDYYDVMLGTPFLRRVKANIDFNGLGSIVPSRDIAPTSGIEMFNRKERRIISSARVSLQLTKDDFNRLRSQWKEQYSDLFGEILLELPPMREVNHRIKLIDPDKQFSYRLPKCPEALQPQLHATIDHYLKAGWWEPTTASQAVLMLCI
ncbi:hypothetical protein M422DRAFT_191666, partial [Sphaerobolus stellatus SS14]